jgi:radical SAM protein with 4Fe4S-binding SPASM domain
MIMENKSLVKTDRLNKTYVLNPEYILLSDTNRMVLTFSKLYGENSATSIIHPVYAVLFSLFNGDRILKELLKEITEIYDINEDEAYNLVDNFIENEKQINIEYDGVIFGFPPNIIINNINKIIRTDIDADFFKIQEPYDFKSKRFNTVRRVFFILNMTCCTDCIYCYADRKTPHTPLPLQKVLDIIDEAKSYGVVELNISGGDIFANKNWYVILKKIFDSGYTPYLSTKMALMEHDIEQLQEIGATQIQISLDTLNPKLARQNLKVSSEYVNKVKESIRLLDKKGIKIILKSTVTKHTCTTENISELLAFAKEMQHVTKYTFTPFAYSQYKTVKHFNDFKPSLEQIMDVKDMLEDLRTNLHFDIHIDDATVSDGLECANSELFGQNTICSGNMDSIIILPDGKVTICEELYWNKNFILGDLKLNTIHEIWTSQKAVSLWYLSQNLFPKESICSKCDTFKACRHRGKVCWKKVIAAYGRENWLYPDISCPKAPKPTKPIFYDNTFLYSGK